MRRDLGLSYLGFPDDSVAENPPANAGYAGDACSIPESGISPGGRNGNPLQFSCLENPHGQKSLAGYSPWGHKESDMTEHKTHAEACYRIHLQS